MGKGIGMGILNSHIGVMVIKSRVRSKNDEREEKREMGMHFQY